MASAGAVGLLVLALGVLFAIREVFIEKPKRQKSSSEARDFAESD
jgi:hypothetical protein